MTVSSAASPTPLAVPPSPVGALTASRRWRDPRLLAGVVLVVASVVAMALVMGASDQRVAVWSVAGDVPSGSPVTDEDLVAVDVQLPNLDAYLLADGAIPEDMVAARDFAAGELLTLIGFRPTDDPGGARVVTLPVLRNQMPADLSVGDRVDVYVVERTSAGEPEGSPRLVLERAVVADVDDDGGAFGASTLETGVALTVREDEVAAVVDAQSRGTVTLVDVPVGSP